MNTIIIDGLSFALPLFVMAIGGIYSERSGVTNLAIEGLQGFGAFVGALFVVLVAGTQGTDSQTVFYLSFLFATLGGMAYALLHALLCVKFKANQVISGVVINILAMALTAFLTKQVNKSVFNQPSDKFQLGVSTRFTVPVLSDIPVIGAGESTAALSLFYGKTPALLGITSDVPDGYRRILGGRIVSNARGEGVESVLDLMTPEGYSATVDRALQQKKLGAEVIALSCTGMSTLQIAPALEKATGLPVLDPVLCAGMVTYFELLRREMRKVTV